MFTLVNVHSHDNLPQNLGEHRGPPVINDDLTPMGIGTKPYPPALRPNTVLFPFQPSALMIMGPLSEVVKDEGLLDV
jgi:hypothetical protein